MLNRLRASGRELLLLSFDQLTAFAGNMLELRTDEGKRLIAMSQQALNSLDGTQLDLLEKNGGVLAAPIDTIESSSGGSVRCMLAEIHLPRRN